jgi:hypothetical protein
MRIRVSSAADPRPEDTARPGFYRRWRQALRQASGLASIMSHLRRREEQRTSAQDAAVKSLAILQARKAILFHRREELIAQIAGERIRHRATSSLIAELVSVNTEILAIG